MHMCVLSHKRYSFQPFCKFSKHWQSTLFLDVLTATKFYIKAETFTCILVFEYAGWEFSMKKIFTPSSLIYSKSEMKYLVHTNQFLRHTCWTTCAFIRDTARNWKEDVALQTCRNKLQLPVELPLKCTRSWHQIQSDFKSISHVVMLLDPNM